MKIIELLTEVVYQEEDDSTFTHFGVEYDLNKLLRLTHGQQPTMVPMGDLEWNLMNDLNADRVAVSDPSVPLLVTIEDGVVYVLDGNHRLVKAHRAGDTEMPVIIVDHDLLVKCALRDDVVSVGQKSDN